jgi:hypothetical protein
VPTSALIQYFNGLNFFRRLVLGVNFNATLIVIPARSCGSSYRKLIRIYPS